MKQIVLKKIRNNIKPNFKIEFSNEILEIPYEENETVEKPNSKYTKKNKYFSFLLYLCLYLY